MPEILDAKLRVVRSELVSPHALLLRGLVRRLLDQIRNSRQSPLRRQPVNRGEKFLQALEALLALDRDQRLAMAMTRPLPATGHLGRAHRNVLLAQQLEARRVDEVLVHARRREHEKADRAAQGQVVVGHRPGYYHGVGENSCLLYTSPSPRDS